MKGEQNLHQVIQGLPGEAGSSVGESWVSFISDCLVMDREICLELRVGSETQGATRPGGLKCHAKDFPLCPVDFGAALGGFVKRRPVAASPWRCALMTLAHIGKSLLSENGRKKMSL